MAVYDTISILGLGLIGGAVGIRIKKTGAARKVKALVRRREVIELAAHLEAADYVTLDPEKSVAGADLIILATSVATIPDILAKVVEYLEPGCTVTDVGSTKTRLLNRCREVLQNREDVHLVGSHPISGTEKRGLLNCEGVVLPDHLCLVVPVTGVPDEVNRHVREFWEMLGMKTLTMDAETHDRTLAMASHAPHYVASALMAVQTDESMVMSAGGLKDTTRIAQSDPKLWAEIAMENAPAIAAVLRKTAAEISKCADRMDKREQEAVRDWFAANALKRKLGLEKRGAENPG